MKVILQRKVFRSLQKSLETRAETIPQSSKNLSAMM